MNGSSSTREGMPKPDKVNFAVWTGIMFLGHSIGYAIFLGAIGLIFDLAIPNLWKPYLLLVYCGLLFGPLSYWARIARERPQTCARRFAIVCFLYFQILVFVLLYSATDLKLLNRDDAIGFYSLCLVPFNALVCLYIYRTMHQKLEKPGQS